MGLIAVNFHYIRKDFNTPFPGIFGIVPEEFEERLLLYKTYGNFVSQKELLEIVQSKKEPVGNYFHLTFDDGLAEQFVNALPILDRLKIPATFFVNTSHFETGKLERVHEIHLIRSRVSGENIMQDIEECISEESTVDFSEAALKGKEHYKYDSAKDATLKYILNFQLDDAGLEKLISYLFEKHKDVLGEFNAEKYYMNKNSILELSQREFLGSHGHRHYPIALRTAAEQEQIIRKSSTIIEEICATKMRLFSYPYGSQESVKGLESLLEVCGYQAAFTMERAWNKSLASPYFLSRLDNNDMPGGKAWKHGSGSPFEVYPLRNWFLTK